MLKKTVKILIVVLVFLSVFTSIVVSQNDFHKEHCIEHDCPKCAIIMFAKSITELLKLFLIYTNLIILIHYIICSKNFTKNKILKVNSLVFQKVQFNE